MNGCDIVQMDLSLSPTIPRVWLTCLEKTCGRLRAYGKDSEHGVWADILLSSSTLSVLILALTALTPVLAILDPTFKTDAPLLASFIFPNGLLRPLPQASTSSNGPWVLTFPCFLVCLGKKPGQVVYHQITPQPCTISVL